MTDDDSGFDEQQFDIVVAAPAQGERSDGATDQGLTIHSESRHGGAGGDGERCCLDAMVARLRTRPTNEPPTVWGPGNVTIDEGPFTMSALGSFMDAGQQRSLQLFH